MACSIIIPVFNQLSFTDACLNAVFRTTPANSEVEVIVVDNGSTDGTTEYLQRQSSKNSALRIVSVGSNAGFSKACNFGAEASRGDYLLFLNNDTIPLDGWLTHLLITASLPDVGIVGPKLVYPQTNTINHAGYVYNAGLHAFYPVYHREPPDFRGVTKERDFQAVLGACLLVKRPQFFAAGLFAPYGLEDVDLCLKVRQQGQRVVYNPLSTVLHHGSVTLSQSPPGTIPPTDTQGFEEHWPRNLLDSDDERVYREDGFTLRRMQNGQIELDENVAASNDFLAQAIHLRGASEAVQKRELLQKALDLYPHNIRALHALLIFHRQRGDYLDAMRYAEILRRVEPGNFERHIASAELALLAGNTEKAGQIIEHVRAFPDLPDPICERLALLNGKLS